MKASLATLTLIVLSQIATAQEIADAIWTGSIITMNDDQMRAEAVAVKDGRILSVGTLEEVSKHQARSTAIFELGERTMLPGFVDAHGHVVMGGLQALSANLLAPPDGEVEDIASLQQTLRDWMKANREAVDEIGLIIGFGYDNATLAEQRHPVRQELDAISEDVPILLIHQSGHLFTLNTAALEVAGISADSQDPLGGIIRREADGTTPNGVLEETAGFQALIRLLARIGTERAPIFVEEGTKLWARFGYTTAQEGRASAGTMAILRSVADRGGLPIDVAVYPDVLVDREFVAQNVSPDYDNGVRVAGAKLTIDGSPQGFTAWRDRPYYDPVGDYPPGYRGYASVTPEQVIDAVEWASANNIQLLTHSNGEAATDTLLAAVRAANAKHPGADRRFVLIHGQFLREDQVDGLNELGIIPSLFPMHTFYWGDWHREHTVGPKLADNISPTGWCVQRGMKFTSHHDAPVAFPNSMRVLDATVTRRTRSGDILGPWQRVDVITALKAMTIWPAYQHFEEDTKGSIEPGKLADFVILSADPTAIDPETLDTLQVIETIKEGRVIFTLSPEEQRRAELMLKPATDGSSAFENFLIAASGDRHNAILRYRFRGRFTASAAINPNVSFHEKGCLIQTMDELFDAILGETEISSR
jgi:hypothetical protein